MKALLLHAGYNVSNEISSKFGGQTWCDAAQEIHNLAHLEFLPIQQIEDQSLVFTEVEAPK